VANPEHLPYSQLMRLLDKGATVVDTRPSMAFASAHVPGTINIPYDGSFVSWAGWLLDYEQPFYVIADRHQVEEVTRDLSTIGLDQLAGYFESPGVDAWLEAGQPVQAYQMATAPQVARRILDQDVLVIDVRGQAEWEEGHVPGATHVMLGYLPEYARQLRTDRPVVVQCLSGSRSAIGASILQATGIPAVINMVGGYREWVASGLPTERNGASGH
jgi:hydroxyacylglutathione hydrolase